MNLKYILRTAAVALIFSHGTAFAGSEGWTTDFEAAKKQAAKENKFLLLNFTGSDWCGYCIKLKKEVFSQDAFIQGVKDKFILVELDYPRKPENIAKLSDALIAQNDALQKTYAINRGFPTIYLTDAQGKPFAKTSYVPVGPETYLKYLDELLLRREVCESAIAEAQNKEGAEKARTLIFAMQSMGLNDEIVTSFYANEHAEIIANSPDVAKQMELQKSLMELQNQLNELARNKDDEGKVKLIDEALAAGKFEGDIKQQILIVKSMSLVQLKKPDEALKILDEAEALSPGSRHSAQIKGIKKQIEAQASK